MRMMERQYTRVAELAGPLQPLLGDQTARFTEIASDSAARCREVAAAMDAGDQETAGSVAATITQNCRACHSLEGLAIEGLLKDASNETRATLGIGDGHFVVGYDLRIRHPDRKRPQAVADGIRTASLVLDAAR
jgi:hypothetical protein